MKIRIIAILTTIFVIIISSKQSISASVHFSDVHDWYWAKKEITFLSEKGVITGFPDGTFRPNEKITRKQAAIMISRALGLEVSNRPNQGFKDIVETEIGFPEIAAVVDENIFEKREYFYPNEVLTREEMARCLVIAYGLVGTNNIDFLDVSEGSAYYHYIDKLAANRITTGYKDGTFKPKQAVDRAQFSTFLSRIHNGPLKYEIRKGNKRILEFKSKDFALQYVSKNSGTTVHPLNDNLNTYPNTFLTREEIGINNGVLIYNGYEIDEKYGNGDRYTPGFFEPYIAYEKAGQFVGPYFDTFIILGRKYPNGEFPETSKNDANYRDWKWYLDRTFSTSGVLANLNQAVKNNPNIDKAKVYIAIPYPKTKGILEELNGKQVPVTMYGRYKLVEWYIQEALKRVEAANYEGLSIEGFYWLNETVISPEDERVVALTTQLVHSVDKKFIYSPHARSTNLANWKSYGFDGAYLQMNAFKQIHDLGLSTNLLHSGLLNALTHGTGVTIEIEDSTINIDSVFANLRNYIDKGRLYQLNNKSILMYQGTEMIHRLATNLSVEYRKMYDDLYEFLNGGTTKKEEIIQYEF